jgi:hypothetical protein
VDAKSSLLLKRREDGRPTKELERIKCKRKGYTSSVVQCHTNQNTAIFVHSLHGSLFVHCGCILSLYPRMRTDQNTAIQHTGTAINTHGERTCIVVVLGYRRPSAITPMFMSCWRLNRLWHFSTRAFGEIMWIS